MNVDSSSLPNHQLDFDDFVQIEFKQTQDKSTQTSDFSLKNYFSSFICSALNCVESLSQNKKTNELC